MLIFPLTIQIPWWFSPFCCCRCCMAIVAVAAAICTQSSSISCFFLFSFISWFVIAFRLDQSLSLYPSATHRENLRLRKKVIELEIAKAATQTVAAAENSAFNIYVKNLYLNVYNKHNIQPYGHLVQTSSSHAYVSTPPDTAKMSLQKKRIHKQQQLHRRTKRKRVTKSAVIDKTHSSQHHLACNEWLQQQQQHIQQMMAKMELYNRIMA